MSNTEIIGSKMKSENGPGQNGSSQPASDLNPAKPTLPADQQRRDVGVSTIKSAHGHKNRNVGSVKS
jgi:hypothetical protein